MEEDIKVFGTANPTKQESLQTETEVDPMEGEQTWPTEQELLEADGSFLIIQTFAKHLLSVFQSVFILNTADIM